jgi:hypothetical protein
MSTKTSTPTAENMVFASSIVQQLDVLAVRRKEWETTDYKKANDGLYTLLAECLNVYQARFVKGSLADQKALRVSLVQRLQADRVRVVKTTTTLTMLARFVFNSDRKRAHGYGYVLAAAVSQGVQSKDFAIWVAEQGGIEEIKRLMVKKAEAIVRQQAVQAATVVVSDEVATNAIRPLAHVELHGLTGTYALLLAKPNVAGGVDIVGTLSEVDEALFKALIVRMAKKQVAAAEVDKELGRQVSQEHSDMLSGSEEQQLLVVNG